MTDEELANPSPRVLKSREQARAWRAANPERKKASDLAWRAANKDKTNAAGRARHKANPEYKNDQSKAYHQANKVKRAADGKVWRDTNKESIKAKALVYYQANKEKQAASGKAYRLANPEKTALRHNVYRLANLNRINEKARLHNNRRNARKRNLPNFTVSKKDVARLLRDPCAVTDCSNVDIHIDHVIPISRGGSHGIGNFQSLCRYHNMSKGAKTWMEYRVYLGLVA